MIIRDNTEENPVPATLRSGAGSYVTVFLTPFKTGVMKNFRCVNCGKLLFEYESTVGLIVDSGDSPKDKAPINRRCNRCKLMYLILW
jgi:phage FluMu protein Com